MRGDSNDQAHQKRHLTLVFNVLGLWLLGCGCFELDLGGGGCAYAPEFELERPSFTPGTNGLGEGGLLFALLDPLPSMGSGSCVETLRVTTFERVGVRCLSTRAIAIGSLANGSLAALDQDGNRLVEIRQDGTVIEIASGFPGGSDLAISAHGRFGAVVTSAEILALSFDQDGNFSVLGALALDTSDRVTAIAEVPLVLLDQEDENLALEQEGYFLYAAQSSSNGLVGVIRMTPGSAVAGARLPLVNPDCSMTSATDVHWGAPASAVLDADCGAAYRIAATQDTGATIVHGSIADSTTVVRQRQLAWSSRTGEFFALAGDSEIAIDFSTGTTDSAGSFSTPASAHVSGYGGTRIWIAHLAIDSSFAPSLSSFDPETNAFTPAVYAFEVPGAAVRDLAYRDRPPTMGLAGFPPPVKANRPLVVHLRAEDPDGDALTEFLMEEGPNGAEFTSTGGDGTFRWTPTCSQAGNHVARFTVSAAGWSASGILRFDVPECD